MRSVYFSVLYANRFFSIETSCCISQASFKVPFLAHLPTFSITRTTNTEKINTYMDFTKICLPYHDNPVHLHAPSRSNMNKMSAAIETTVPPIMVKNHFIIHLA